MDRRILQKMLPKSMALIIPVGLLAQSVGAIGFKKEQCLRMAGMAPYLVPTHAVRVALFGIGKQGMRLFDRINRFGTDRPSEFNPFQVTSLNDQQESLDAIGEEIDLASRDLLSPIDGLRVVNSLNNCDAVVIATPMAVHFQYAKEALEAGKHVFLEKPATGSASQLRELVELAKRKGLVFHVGFLERHRLREIMNNPRLAGEGWGRAQEIVIHRLHEIPQPDPRTPAIFDLGSHDLDLLLNLFWESVEVAQIEVSPLAIPAREAYQLNEPGGRMATIHTGYNAHIQRTIQFFKDPSHSLTVDLWEGESGNLISVTGENAWEDAVLLQRDPMGTELLMFAEAVNAAEGGGAAARPGAVQASEALRVLELLEKIAATPKG